jgi:hypothetical protein
LKKFIPLLFLGLLFIFNSAAQNQTTVSISEFDLKFPVIIDTSKSTCTERNATWLSTADYELLYIGVWRDSVYVDYTLKYYPVPPPPPGYEIPLDTLGFHQMEIEHMMFPYYLDWLDTKSYKYWHSSQLSVSVDTSQRVKNDEFTEDWDSPFSEAYPVLIQNIGLDTIRIGYGHFLPLITEAKDSAGFWNPIQKEWRFFCGNGVGSIILPPKQIGVSATTIYQGSYKTTLRLRIGDNFSNEFEGWINYTQFGYDLDEDGN